MENDGDAWHTASARGKGPKSARQQRQPIKVSVLSSINFYKSNIIKIIV